MYDVHVQFVDEDALPEGHAWVIGATADGGRFLFVKRGAAITAAIIADAWQGGLLLNSPALRLVV